MAGTRGNHLLAVYVGIPSEIEDEFHKWYNTQYVPEQLAIPGFQSATRYVSLEDTPKYMAFYELDHARVLETPAYKRRVQPGGNMYAVCSTGGHVQTMGSPAPNWRGMCGTQY